MKIRVSRPGDLFWIALSVVTLAAFYVLNALTPLSGDDFRCLLIIGPAKPVPLAEFETIGRITSMADIVVSLKNLYTVWGGRVIGQFFAHLLVVAGKGVFNLANTAVYALFVFLICFHVEGRVKKITPPLFFAVNILLWFLVPAWGQDFLWLTGSCNYLWTSTIVLLFLIPYRKNLDDGGCRLNVLCSILFFALGVIAGWCNENTSAAVFLALLLWFMTKIVRKERFRLFEPLGFAGFVIGMLLMISAPGNYERLSLIHESGVFVFKYLKRMIVVILMYCESNGLLLTMILGICAADLWVHQKKPVNLTVCFYCVAGIASAFSMVLSPAFPSRAALMVTVFLIIAVVRLVREIDVPPFPLVQRCRPFIIAAALILMAVSYMEAGRNIAGVYLRWRATERSMAAQKAQGVLDVEVKIPPAPYNSHAQSATVSDNPAGWMNPPIADYYGVRSVTGVAGTWESQW